jgi:hypothetical protein
MIPSVPHIDGRICPLALLSSLLALVFVGVRGFLRRGID